MYTSLIFPVCANSDVYKRQALISNVLFVPDRKHPSMYHPRIAVQNDFIFGQKMDFIVKLGIPDEGFDF